MTEMRPSWPADICGVVVTAEDSYVRYFKALRDCVLATNELLTRDQSTFVKNTYFLSFCMINVSRLFLRYIFYIFP